MNTPTITVGIYRHFKGNYYYVTGLSKSATDEATIMVNYFDVCNPHYGTFVRPLDDFVTSWDEEKHCYILDRKDNVTGQNCRFERVKDLNFQLGSVSTEQLIEELRNRMDSPIHALDIEGLQSKVFSTDYVVGVPYDNPEFSRGVDTTVVCDTLFEAQRFLATHSVRKAHGIYKRTFIKM